MHQANHSYFQGNNAWKWSQENTQMPPTPIPAHPPYPSIPPFWKKSPGYRLPRAQITSSHSSPSRSVPFVSKKSPVPARELHGRTRESWLPGWVTCLPNRKSRTLRQGRGKSMGFLSLSSRVACPQVVKKAMRIYQCQLARMWLKYCSNWNVKFQASKMAWFSETVRWGLIQTAKFHLVTTHPSRCTNLSISNVMMPEGTTPLQWKHILSWQVGMKVDLCWSPA